MTPQQAQAATQNWTEELRIRDERLICLLELSSAFYWELDDRYRFSMIWHRDEPRLREMQARLLGKRRWDIPGGKPENDSWTAHQATLDARLPFANFVVRQSLGENGDCYMRSSGQPVFANDGAFMGYRGITEDITEFKRDQRLLQLEHAVTKILIEMTTPADTMQAAIQAICESECWDAGYYWAFDETRALMKLDAAWNNSDTQHVTGRHSKPIRHGALARLVCQTREPLWIADLQKENGLTGEQTVPLRKGSALFFPVFTDKGTIGVLEFNAPRIFEPDKRLRQIVRLLGMHIGNFYERSIALERLSESEERYSSTVELAAIGISHVDQGGQLIHVNAQFCDMLGYSKEELLKLTVTDISHPDDINSVADARAKLHAGLTNSFKAEKRYMRSDGTSVWGRMTVALKRDEEGKPLYDIAVVEDISEQKFAEERVQYLATHDDMTGLPNRTMFGELLDHTLESARRHERKCALLFIDLDRFKVINDSLGHQNGDILLRETALRLKTSVRSSDVVARLGGDEFVVMLDSYGSFMDVADIARDVLSAVLEPIEIMGQECRVTASIGIARFPRDATDSTTLMRHADIAMYHAKEEGKNNFQFYSPELSPMSAQRLVVETHLRRALENKQLSVQYQAKVDLKSGKINGTEALIRWNHPQLGAVSPAQFIPVAEDTGLIVPIGKWVLRTACEQNMAWQRQGLPRIVMAVNLSPRQFKDPNLLNDIAETLEQTRMAPELLELEITESMIMSDVDQIVERVAAIKNLGVRFAIDDFGTGYSSLSQLKRFPIDTLKIDRSFIRDIPSNAEDKAITDAIISMGKTLGVTLVAEGVETVAQRTFLRRRGCDEMQGFLFSKPCHPEEFAQLLCGDIGNERIAASR
jgi:diguanylate cyclase (GGDEF)-like protein/PAS domain S-box-containing protein